jgi:hypothetical protein
VVLKKITMFLFRTSFLWIALSSPAHAYVDPGSALLLFQGLFAAVGAALTFSKKPWRLIAKLFARKKDIDA